MLITLLASCHHEETTTPDPDAFPEGFAWGSATAGFQVEMGCPTWSAEDCEDRNSDWYQWVTTPSIIETGSLYVTGEPVSDGPGMWETFEDDVARMRDDGHTAFRMSLEWSRLFPDGAAEQATTVDELVPYANAAAVQRYHEVFDALHQAGIRPVVTINHYVLPLWVHDGVACHEHLDTCSPNGWLDGERITRLISLYAGFVAREYGADVDDWYTLNEPFATTLSGYMLPGPDRSAPPGVSNEIEATRDVTIHQVEASAAMYDAVKAEDPTATVGIVMNMTAIDPNDPNNPADVLGAEHMDWLYHRVFLEALTSGDWDDDLDGTIDSNRPELAGRLDVIGVNYYNRVTVLGLPFPLYPEILPVFDFFPEFSWEPYEEGLGRVLREAGEYGLPVWVTENGTPYVEEDGVPILEGHVASMHEAIDAGVDVRGYLYWSWVDNYEWNHGLDLRFGLYTFDPATKERIERPAAARLRQYAAENRL
ncbi:MAG: glycoside hydrolase family 1 protein [Alphaproteobacteria bacterium]|nr:glycoside hydrolase family 1 protein [Alphaproteobacteria bacterium]MCB9695500.1 glycoside hydrolase family 1 protein [Alphaproteobacteria bacterium]